VSTTRWFAGVFGDLDVDSTSLPIKLVISVPSVRLDHVFNDDIIIASLLLFQQQPTLLILSSILKPPVTMISATQYSSKRNSLQVLSSLNAMRYHPRFRDVILLVGDRRLPAQRHVLAAFSDYFRAMFEHDLTESGATEIRLEDLDADAVNRILDFCYESKIEISATNVEALLATATFLQVEEVREYCCEFLELHTDVINCLDIRRLARLFHCDGLVEATTKFLQYHFAEVAATDAFFLLDVEELAGIVSLSNLRVESETGVFESVMSWARADPDHRSPCLHLLLRHVRFPLMDAEYLETVACDEMVAGNTEVVEILEDVKDFLATPKVDRPRSKRWWSRPRHRGKKCVAGHASVAPTASVTSTGELVAACDPHWTCYDFGSQIRILRAEFRWSCSAPLTIQLECSNDAKHWKLLSRTTTEKGGYWQPHVCDIAVPLLHRFYRLYFTLAFHKMNVEGEAVRRWRIGIRDVKMYEAVEENITPVLFP